MACNKLLRLSYLTKFPNSKSLRPRNMIFLTLSTFLRTSFALPLHSNDDSNNPVTCVPADFKSVLVFFFANYAVHAATVPSVAGRPAISVFWIIFSLFYPFFGLIRSVVLLFHYSLAKDQIGKAISQGAVMVAARSSDWAPRFTRCELIYVGLLRDFSENTNRSDELPKARFHTIPDIYESLGSPPFHAVETKYIALSGEASLPKGYFWSKPGITQLDALASHTLKREDIQVGLSRNIVKGFASVAQLVSSCLTMYQARGSQIQRYGYAAFGLSVFPYTLMSLVNLVVVTIVGEYSTLFILRTAISDEAKRCGGTISGEIGTLPEATQSANALELAVEEDRSLNGLEKGNDGEDRHFTSLPKLDDSNNGAPELLGKSDGEKENLLREAMTTLPEAKDIESVETGEEETDGPGVPLPEDPAVFLSGKPLIAANLRVEDDGVLVIAMKGQIRRFRLIEGDDDDPLTFHFYVSAVTNQEKVPKRENSTEKVSLVFCCFNLLLIILPYVFIFLLTGFRKGDSTSAQRGWMMSWLVVNQILTFYGFGFSTTDISSPVHAAKLGVIILVWLVPAIGGLVTVGRMLLEFGTCSVS